MRYGVRILTAAAMMSLAACSAREAEELGNTDQMQPVAGEAYVVELVNPMTHAMTVSYSQGGTTQTLGEVPAGKSVTFAIPNRGDSDFRLHVSGSDGKQIFEKRVDLKKGTTNRVELKH